MSNTETVQLPRRPSSLAPLAPLEKKLARAEAEVRAWRIAVGSAFATAAFAALGVWLVDTKPPPPTPVAALAPPVSIQPVTVAPPPPAAAEPPAAPPTASVELAKPAPVTTAPKARGRSILLATPTAIGMGALTVVCTPKCDSIKLDSEQIGPGHLFNRPVPTGRHVLELHAPGCSIKPKVTVEITQDHTTELRAPFSDCATPTGADYM